MNQSTREIVAQYSSATASDSYRRRRSRIVTGLGFAMLLTVLPLRLLRGEEDDGLSLAFACTFVIASALGLGLWSLIRRGRGWRIAIVAITGALTVGLIAPVTPSLSRAWRQHQIVTQIQSLGGTVGYKNGNQGGWYQVPFEIDLPVWIWYDLKGDFHIPPWVFKLMSMDLFFHANSVSLDGSRVSDSDIALLRGLPQLRTLSLSETAVTDAGIEHLAGMTNLGHVLLDRTSVTDHSVSTLSQLPSLWIISVIDTEVTSAGVRLLKQSLPRCAVCCGSKGQSEWQ